MPAWWRDSKLGIFVHWTPASVPAFAPTDAEIGELLASDDPHALARVPSTEWYENSLRFPGSPVARHHAATYGSRPYAAFARRPDIKVVSVVHHDTPSGTINPVKEIGRIVADHDALMIVDAVSSWGGMDIHPEDCHADIFVTGPNKCLGGAPGLTLLYVSDRAWRHMEANEAAPRASMLSILDWREAWRSDKPFPFTPSVAEINGLDAALDNYLAEGPERVWARHALTARACRRGVEAMGLALWPARESIAADTVTAVRVPDGVADATLRDAVRRLYGVTFSAGRGETLGKLIRIGHMGPVANPIYAVAAVAALGGALLSLGHKADVGAGVAAALAEINRAA